MSDDGFKDYTRPPSFLQKAQGISTGQFLLVLAMLMVVVDIMYITFLYLFHFNPPLSIQNIIAVSSLLTGITLITAVVSAVMTHLLSNAK
jgi:hypothetical protein